MTRRWLRLGGAVPVAVAVGLTLGGAPAVAVPAAGTNGQVVRVEHYDPSTTPARGPTNALVTVELFFAPSINGNSRLPAYRRLEALQQRHPTRMRLIYRIVQRGAQPPGPQLPTLALEAYAQGKFFEFIDAVHAERQTLTRDKMLELAESVGLDPQRADRAIGDDRYRDVIAANERRLERLRSASSPAVYFNGKPARSSLNSMTDAHYESAYQDAYDRAREMLDKGIAPQDLVAAFDAEVLAVAPPTVITTGPTDDPDVDRTTHPLASPPLDLTGLPSFGRPDAHAPVPVVILCRPNDASCNGTLRIARKLQNTFRDEVRIVWAPWFDVTRDDAAELTLLGDAALCAEATASSPDDLDASPGWLWVVETYTQVGRSHGRRVAAETLIDKVTARLRINPGELSGCRARTASATLAWVAAARRSGVTGSPAIILGGRIYQGLNDERVLSQLLAAELTPGILGRCATTGC